MMIVVGNSKWEIRRWSKKGGNRSWSETWRGGGQGEGLPWCCLQVIMIIIIIMIEVVMVIMTIVIVVVERMVSYYHYLSLWNGRGSADGDDLSL